MFSFIYFLISNFDNQDTGEILFASDIKIGLEVADKMITFEQDEMKSIRKFGPPGN